MFREFGKVLTIRICTNTGSRIYYKNSYDQKQIPKNTPFLIAFVCFETEESAKNSLVKDGTEINGNVIKVSFDRTNTGESSTAQNQYHPKRTIFVGNLPYGE